MPTDYIKAADLHAALARVRDETKAKVWAEAYAAGRKDEADQYAKAIQLVTLGRALTGGPAVVTQPLGNSSGTVREQFLTAPTTVADPVAEAARNVKAFAENPALPRRENPDGPAYGKLLQLPEGWVHPDGAVTPLTHAGEAHVAALAEADPGVSQAFHASLARHAHRDHPGEFVDDDVKDYAFDKGFIHLTGRGRTIEATGKHEMLLKHRKFLKELAMRATTLVFRPVDGDDYEVKAKADRERKAIPADPRHRTADVLGTHAVVRDALSRGDTQYANRQREIHADALVDAGADREAALERVIAGQQPPSHLAATFKNAANLKRAARSRTEAAHGATEEAYQQFLDNGPPIGNTNGIVIDHAEWAFDWSHGAQFSSRLGEQKAAGEHHDRAAWRHDRTAADMIERGFPELAALHRHAAEQHRIAAAYNAAAHHADSQRTVKAQEDYHPRFRDELHDAGREHEMEGPPTPGLRTQEAYVVSDRLMDEALHTHGLHVPYSSLENAHEKALDAADMGDDAGHRYWKKRLGDVHLMLAGEAHAAKDTNLAAEHDKFAAHLHGKSGNQLDEEHEAAAHLIAHHKGDVAAAAKHASEAAIKATDPELLKTGNMGAGEEPGVRFPTAAANSHESHKTYEWRHGNAAHAIRNAPDTYRSLTADDIDRHEAGMHTGGFYRPAERGDQQYFFTTPRGVVHRDPADPTKFSLTTSNAGTIDHENVNTFHTIDMDARQHRHDVQQMHEVAALLHREAATGDHEKREVKAERKAFAPGIEAEPGAAGRTLHPTAGHPAADNNEAALHAAMLVQPHDTTPRMVLADYYDDHDQPHTAALHRFVAEPTRANFDTLAAFHEHPSEVAHTVEHAAATHANATIPRWVVVDRGVDHDAERRHPATGAITPTGLRNELDNVIHRNAYHPSVQRFPADSPSRTERRLTRDSLMWHHQRYGEEQANFAAAHADPNTVADWGPDPISEQGHAFARTLHHAAAEAHRHARDYLTEQDALDKPTTNDGPIPEGVWRHPRLNRERTV